MTTTYMLPGEADPENIIRAVRRGVYCCSFSNGPDSLTRVSMVGNDLQISEGGWACGKHGHWVPVSFGLPTVLVDGITVGGTRQ